RRARNSLARRRRARAPVSLRRRRCALPRVVRAAAARDAGGIGNDAAAVGGRAAERPGRGARDGGGAGRGRHVTVEAGLARRLGTGDAVVIGLGSMVGAGVFSAFAPAAAAAGSGLLIGLALAAGVAYCNAVASAQLAAQYPTSGGTYVYGRERLGEWWGFLAGWGFVVGKTASCAAMALTFATYALDGPRWLQRLVAFAAVLVLAGVNYHGITRTAGLTRLLVAGSLLALLVFVLAVVTGEGTSLSKLGGVSALGEGGVHGTLQAAGLLFFAFAGYARVATLGEEVARP